jgi:GTP-binding protein
VSEIAGTTRDSIDTPFTYNKRSYVLIDTAGIRRKSRIVDRLETLSVVRSIAAIERADVVVVVVAANEGLTDQDTRLVQLAAAKYKPILVVVNKWDLVLEKEAMTATRWQNAIRAKIQDLAFVPIMFVSCTENQRVHKILSEIETLAGSYTKRVTTALLNKTLEEAVRAHTPHLISAQSKRVKFYYATQVRAAPPTIVVKCNFASEIQVAYKRYLSHRFRDELGFHNIPLNVIFRGKSDERDRDVGH